LGVWGVSSAALVLGGAVAFAVNPAQANPLDGNVVAGAADIVQESATALSITQHTAKVIIDWRSFSIAAGERTTFYQPSSSSLAVNRVIGNDPSHIFGQLAANGRIMLINQNGILFGAGSRVDVAGLIATTINIPNNRILTNDFRFDILGRSDAMIINHGAITAAEGGLVALVAPGVENTGVIQARLGTVTLASGNAFTLDLYGDGLVQIAIDAPVVDSLYDANGNPLAGLVSNAGTIAADGGTVLLTAKAATGVVNDVINMDGVVQAQSVAEVNGEIVLMGGDEGVVNVAGILDASGNDANESGGTVKVLGDKVGLFENAFITASGDAGGGEVLIGGNFQGNGPEANASRTFVDTDATITADAVTNGDGGRVIVWADDTTRYYGSISATGGANSGDGGFAEVSGKQNLTFDGSADLTATTGETGTLLLDPSSITVAATNDGFTALTEIDAFADADSGANTIGVGVITASASNVVLQATGDITFSADLTNANAGAGLIAQAGGNITVNNAISLNNAALTLEADSPHSTSGAADGTGTLTIDNVSVASGGGDITLIGADFAIDTTTAGDVNAGAGAVNIAQSEAATITIGTGILSTAEIASLASTGAVSIGQATTAGSDGAGASPVTINSAAVELDAALSVSADVAGTFQLFGAYGITLNGSLTTAQATTINADSDANGSGTFIVSVTKTLNTTDHTLDITTDDIDVTGALNSGAAAATISESHGLGIGFGGTAVTGGLNLSDVELANITATGLTLSTTGNIKVNGITAVNSNNIAATTNLTSSGGSVNFLTAASTFNTLAVNAVTGSTLSVDLTTDTGDLVIDADTDNATSGTLTFNKGSLLTLTSAGAMTLDATTGGISLGGTGGVTMNAVSGVTFDDRLATTAGAYTATLTIDADTDNTGGGTFTAASWINTNNNTLTLTADDIALSNGVTTGYGATPSITDSDGTGIGLGDATVVNGLNISGAELEFLTTTSDVFTIQTAGDITVNNITAANSNNLVGTLELASTAGAVNFSTADSTFNTLTVNAVNGVNVDVGLTADTGGLTIDADTDNATSGALAIASGVTLTSSASSITLDATTGGISAAGPVTLNAAANIYINDNMTAGGLVTIDGDTDASGSGSFQMGSGKTLLTNDNDLSLNANDINLIGAINAGTGTVSITESQDAGINVGFNVGGKLQFDSGSEFQQITAGALTLSTAGTIEVRNISATNSNNISGTTTLTSTAGAVNFTTGASTFNALAVNAVTGSTLSVDLTTDTGGLVIDADTDNATSGTLTFNKGSLLTLTSAGAMTLDATTGGISLGGTGGVTMNAVSGVTFNDRLATTAGPYTATLTIDADTDNTGGGTFTAASWINTNNNTLTLTADDIALSNGVNTGYGATPSITDSDGTGIGLGDATVVNGLNISGAELEFLTTTSDVFTIQTAGDITVNNITAANSNNLVGTLKLVSTAGAVNFSTADSTFNTLTVNAANGVSVNRNLIVDSGGLNINADSDGAGGGTFTLGAFTIASVNNAISITADKVDIGDTIDAGSGAVTIKGSAAQAINLGSTVDTTAATVELSNAELQSISAASLTIGSAAGGAISISADVTPGSSAGADVTTVHLASGGAVTGTAGGIVETDLAITAGGTINFTDTTTDVTTLAVSATGQSVSFTDIGATSIGSVAGVAGINAGSLTVTAVDGITLSNTVVSNSTTQINADSNADGTGDLQVDGALDTNDGALEITTNDLILNSTLDSGSNSTTITDSDGTGIGFGATAVAGGLNVTNAELGNITAADFYLKTNASMVVDGIASGTKNLYLTADDDSNNSGDITDGGGGLDMSGGGLLDITTENIGSSGTRFGIVGSTNLTVNANNSAYLDLTSLPATMTALDVTGSEGDVAVVATGDLVVDDATLEAANTVSLTVSGKIAITPSGGNNFAFVGDGDITVSGAGIGTADDTLEFTCNTCDGGAALSLTNTSTTGIGVYIGDDSGGGMFNSVSLSMADAASSVAIEFSNGDTIDITGGATVSTVTDITMDNDSMAFSYTLNDATGSIAVDSSNVTAGGNFSLSSASNITLGTGSGGAIDTSNGAYNVTLTADNDNSGAGAIVDGGGSIDMSGTGTLELSAGSGIGTAANPIETVSLTDVAAETDTGGIFLNNSNSGNVAVTTVGGTTGLSATSGDIALTNAVGSISTSQAITATGGGVSLSATTGITLGSGLTASGATELNADSDLNGTSDLTVNAAVATGGGTLDITANDLILNSTLNSGAAATTVTDSDGTGIGFGTTEVVNGLNLSGDELQVITATGLTLNSAGNITIHDITATNNVNIAGTTTLNSTGGAVNFSTSASTFKALDVNAADGITVGVAVTTDTGALALDGDSNNAVNANDNIALNAALTSAGVLTLDATTGGIDLGTGLTLTSVGAATFNDTIDGNFALTVNAGSGDIAFNGIVGGATALDAVTLTGGALTGALNVATLTITGDSAVLTGTVGGQGSQAAADTITFTGTVGTGPYTMNGFAIAGTYTPAPAATTTTTPTATAITVATTVLAPQVAGSTSGGTVVTGVVAPTSPVAAPSTPSQGAFVSDFSVQPMVPDVFQSDFALVEVPTDMGASFGGLGAVGGNFWSTVGGAPTPTAPQVGAPSGASQGTPTGTAPTGAPGEQPTAPDEGEE